MTMIRFCRVKAKGIASVTVIPNVFCFRMKCIVNPMSPHKYCKLVHAAALIKSAENDFSVVLYSIVMQCEEIPTECVVFKVKMGT